MLHLQRREVLIGLASVTLAQAVFGRIGAVLAADKIKPTASSALIVVDVQNCFLPGGSLAGYLKERGIDTVFITGLATDFCVAWTAIDARHAGLTTYVVEDACRGIDIGGSLAKAWTDMTEAGVKKIQSSDIAV